MHHQVQELGDIGLERAGFRRGFGHGRHVNYSTVLYEDWQTNWRRIFRISRRRLVDAADTRLTCRQEPDIPGRAASGAGNGHPERERRVVSGHCVTAHRAVNLDQIALWEGGLRQKSIAIALNAAKYLLSAVAAQFLFSSVNARASPSDETPLSGGKLTKPTERSAFIADSQALDAALAKEDCTSGLPLAQRIVSYDLFDRLPDDAKLTVWSFAANCAADRNDVADKGSSVLTAVHRVRLCRL
jgi:hypothetical protein